MKTLALLKVVFCPDVDSNPSFASITFKDWQSSKRRLYAIEVGTVETMETPTLRWQQL